MKGAEDMKIGFIGCGNMNPDKAYQEPVSQAEAQGYEACKKCF